MKKMNKWPIFLIALFLALPWLLKTNNLVSAAVSVAASPMPRLQFLDANGHPYSGGKVYTYYAGTTTLRATYAESTGTTLNTNPIILDSLGSASIWLSAAVKFVLYDANDVLIYSQDNVSPGAPAGTFSSVIAVTGPSFLGSLQVTGTLNAIGPATFQSDITTSSNSTTTFNGPVIFAGGANYQSNIQTSAGKTASLYYVGAQELTITGKTTATGAIVANGGVTGNLTGNVTGNVTGTSVVSSGTMTLGGSAISVWPSLGCNTDCIFAGASAFQGDINTSNGTSQSMYYLGAQELTVTGNMSVSTSMSIGGRTLTTWVPGQNILVNSEFVGDVHPSQANSGLARSNDTYNVDMWNGYSSAGTYTNFIGTAVDSNGGTYNYMGMGHDSSTANRQYAVVQIIDNALTKPVQGQKVSLSFSAEYKTTNLSASGLSAGILCSTVTADAPNAVYNTVPTLGTAWTLVSSVNTGTLAATWTTYYLENISIPNSCNNIAVTFWTPGTSEVVNATWQIANPKLEAGSGSTPYVPDSTAVSQNKVMRYVNRIVLFGIASSTTNIDGVVQPAVLMRCSSPTISMRNGTSATFSDPQAGGVDGVVSSVSATFGGAKGIIGFRIAGITGLTLGHYGFITPEPTGAANYSNYALFDCEL